MKSGQIYIIGLALFSLFLFWWVIKYGDYLIKEGKISGPFVVENFINIVEDTGGSPETTHTINLPINTTYSCENMCGPMARCSITGEQCSTDVDCYGCQPKISHVERQNTADIGGQNDAGKLTQGQQPTYSVLTTDIGTQAKLFGDKLEPPPQYNQGVNTWRPTFNVGAELFDKRYNPGSQPFMPTYPERTTLSGQFIDDGPLAANDYL